MHPSHSTEPFSRPPPPNSPHSSNYCVHWRITQCNQYRLQGQQ